MPGTGYFTAAAQGRTKTINQLIQEAEARGDKEEVARLNRAAGVQSAIVGIPAGLGDLGVMGYNLLTDSNAPTLTERALEYMGTPTKPTSEEYSLDYNLPNYMVAAYSIGSLGKSGIKALRAWRQNSKMKEFAAKLPEDVKGSFNKWMLTGQGSDDPKVAAVIQNLKTNPDFAELFNTLEKQATQSALKEVAASRISNKQANAALVTRVEAEVDGAKKAISSAGAREFDRAFNLAGESPIVNTQNTRSVIASLKASFESSGSPSAQKALEYLNAIEKKLPATTVQQTVTRTDALGTPIQAVENVSQPSKMTARQIQGWLSDFGKKSSEGDSLINQLSKSDLERINKGVFGAVRDDLKDSFKYVTDKNERAGLKALLDARTNIKTAAEGYDNMVGRGIPAALKGKQLSQIGFDDLLKMYKSSSPEEKVFFREMVKNTDAEALKNIDKRIFDEFKLASTAEKADGTMGLDLKTMATNWAKMLPEEQQAMAMSLGVNSKEFSQRMQDALVFTRKMQVAQPTKEAGAIEKVAPNLGRAAGTASYALKQGVDLTADIIKKFRQGLSDEQIMRVLLNKDAANSLKQATLSKNGAEMLTKLTEVNKYPVTLPTLGVISVADEMLKPEQPQQGPQTAPQGPEEPSVELPPELGGAAPQTAPNQEVELPPDL